LPFKINRAKTRKYAMPKTKHNKQAKKSNPLWVWGVAAIILIAVIGFLVWQQSNPTAQPYPLEITVAQASEKRDQGAFILDVREPSEWTQFHIPDATLIPLGDLPSRLSEVPTDREVVVVCRTGNRSAQGRDILLKAGYTQVTSMAGGVTKWQAQGLPIATGE
jgi:rhodanese-related sulfurtransferase